MDWKALDVVHPDAAGIDIGGSEHWVAISPDRDDRPVRCFECFTPDIEQMADWLAARGVRSVAMRRMSMASEAALVRAAEVVNRAKVAFRQAATSLLKSKSYLGAQFRRRRTKLGAPKATTAMARKLACLFYRPLTKGQQYVNKGDEYYESRHREQQIRSVLKRARQPDCMLFNQKDKPSEHRTVVSGKCMRHAFPSGDFQSHRTLPASNR